MSQFCKGSVVKVKSLTSVGPHRKVGTLKQLRWKYKQRGLKIECPSGEGGKEGSDSLSGLPWGCDIRMKIQGELERIVRIEAAHRVAVECKTSEKESKPVREESTDPQVLPQIQTLLRCWKPCLLHWQSGQLTIPVPVSNSGDTQYMWKSFFFPF